MSNIRFEHRRVAGPSVVWWALGLIAVVILVWVLFGREREAPVAVEREVNWAGVTTEARVSPDHTIAGAPPAVNEYLRFVAEHNGAADADHTHAYTAGGLLELAGALSALLQFDLGTDATRRMQIVALHDQAADLQRDPQSREHARFARDAFATAVDVTQWLQQRNAASAAPYVADLRAAANALEPDTPLLQQTARVQSFFDQASRTLNAMVVPTSS